MTKIPSRLLWLPLVWALLAGGLAAVFLGKAADDFFITYRYAWNLAHGEGFVFNPGEHVFGLTNPGLGLLLALLTLVTRIPIHILGTAVFAASLWGLASLLFVAARDSVERFTVAVGGTLVLSSTVLWINHGSEAAVVLLLLAFSAHLATKRPAVAGVLAGAAVWFRPDAALGVIILLALLWLDERQIPWRLGVTAATVVLLGVGAAYWYFGDMLPATLEAKRSMAASRPESWTGPIRFWQRSIRILLRHWGDGLLVVVGMGLAGLWPLVQRASRPLRLVALYGVALAIAYPLLEVPFFPWYIVPSVVALLYGLSSLGVELTWSLASKVAAEIRPALQRWFVALCGLVILGVPVFLIAEPGLLWLERFEGYGRYETYKVAARWVKEHSTPEQRIAYGEIGALAYFSERPVDDLMGLTTPRSLPFVLAGDGEGAFLASPPDFFFEHPDGPHRGLVHRKWFRDGYALVATIPGEPGDPGEMRIFRRKEVALLPPPRPPRER
ncbi:MAG: hypothetical protein SX243_24880 [Acidobacteriota bacterium]|nr:hypothetical protein [Acidobacteriota bacterium]